MAFASFESTLHKKKKAMKTKIVGNRISDIFYKRNNYFATLVNFLDFFQKLVSGS